MKILAIMRAGNTAIVQYVHGNSVSAVQMSAAMTDEQIVSELEKKIGAKNESQVTRSPADVGDPAPLKTPEAPPPGYEGGNERDILLARAQAIGLKVGGKIGVEALKKRIAEAQAQKAAPANE